MPTVTVLGLAYDSPITDFPVRTGPGTSFPKAVFSAPKGLSGLKVLDVEPDASEVMSDFGRVYNWFHLEFPDGQQGWLRDHVVGIEGDFSAFGYGYVAPLKHAYLVIRDPSTIPAEPEVDDKNPVEELIDRAAKTATQIMQKFSLGSKDEAGEPEAAEAEPAEPAAEKPNLFAGAAPLFGEGAGPATPAEAPAAPEPEPVQVAEKSSSRMRPSDPPSVIIQRAPGTALNARSQPTTAGSSVLFTIPRHARANLVEVTQQDFGQRFRWFKVDYQGQQAWVREDFCRVEGDGEPLGLPWDLYPAPMKNDGWWVRDYNYKPHQDTSAWEHLGWDFGAAVSTPIYCGPDGGRVVQVMDCTKCTSARPSTVLNGLPLGDPSTYSDPGWGYGYGNFVVIGYDWDILPDSTQRWMQSNGYEGGSAFVLYGHLHERKVADGMTLKGEQIIGTCGNTGNSEAPHLHLEMRLGKTSHYSGWSSLRSGLSNPVYLFSR